MDAAGLGRPFQAPFPTGTRRMGITIEQKIDFALESEPHCGSWSTHTESVATEILHQDMWCAHGCEPQSGSWSGVRASSLFPHIQLVPVDYSVGLGGAVRPLMLLASEDLPCVCHLPGGEGSLFLCVCNSAIRKPTTAGTLGLSSLPGNL